MRVQYEVTSPQATGRKWWQNLTLNRRQRRASRPAATAKKTPVPSSISRTADTMSPEKEFYYEGFSGPNGTIVPDDVFDILAPHLKESELRVLLYIIRRTFGFGKSADAISLSQLTDGITTRDGRILDSGTGMSRKGVVSGIKGLVNKGIITVERRRTSKGDTDTNIYKLRFRNDNPPVTHGNSPGNPDTLPPGTSSNHPSSPPPPPPGTTGNTQDSVLQDSESQYTDNNTSVVVSADITHQRLYEDIKAAGIHHKTAAKLIHDNDPVYIRKALDYLQYKLSNGWEARETPAAWLAAAIKEKYDIPDIVADAAREKEVATQRAHEMKRLTAQAETELRKQREQTLRVHRIEQKVDKMWREIQAELREQGKWTPVFSATFLRLTSSDTGQLLAPPALLKRLEPHLDGIGAAIKARTGDTISLEVKSLRRVELE